MRDFETLSRSLVRKLVNQEDTSSWPFLSGDTYKLLSNYVIGSNFKEQLSKLRFEEDSCGSNTFFVSGDLVNELADWSKMLKLDIPQDSKLIIHNSDVQPDIQQLELLKKNFPRIFSVNWLSESEGVTPIPIGLENSKLLRNGVPKDYSRLIEAELPQGGDRRNIILNNYSTSTNYELRSIADRFFRQLPYALTPENFLTPKQYRRSLINTKFVVSPPGNGADCHRTWEAMYLGAVPIVLKSHWPFAKFELPVMVVENWDEVPSRLDETFQQVTPEYLRQTFIEPVFKN